MAVFDRVVMGIKKYSGRIEHRTYPTNPVVMQEAKPRLHLKRKGKR